MSDFGNISKTASFKWQLKCCFPPKLLKWYISINLTHWNCPTWPSKNTSRGGGMMWWWTYLDHLDELTLIVQTNNGFEADIKDFADLKCPVLVQICSLVCCDKKMRTHYTVFIIFNLCSSINVILCQNQPTYRSDNSVADDGRVAQASNRQNQNPCVCIY